MLEERGRSEEEKCEAEKSLAEKRLLAEKMLLGAAPRRRRGSQARAEVVRSKGELRLLGARER